MQNMQTTQEQDAHGDWYRAAHFFGVSKLNSATITLKAGNSDAQLCGQAFKAYKPEESTDLSNYMT